MAARPFVYHRGVPYDFVLTGQEGTTFAVDEDMHDDEPVAVVHLSCPMNVLSGAVELPGIHGLTFASEDDHYIVSANGAFTADEVEQIVAALRHAVRPVEET